MTPLTDKAVALATLQRSLDRCRSEDIRTSEVFAALDLLALNATVKWPFDQFRKALENADSDEWVGEGRRQILNASFNGIRRAVNR